MRRFLIAYSYTTWRGALAFGSLYLTKEDGLPTTQNWRARYRCVRCGYVRVEEIR